MSGAPVVAYEGGVNGYRATKPNKGQKIDPTDPNVVRYVGYLSSKHDQALNGVGGGRKLYGYYYSFNGFAAQLTPDQAAKMALQPDVFAVSPDELQQLDTSSTPAFLGLSDPGGLWSQLGGVGSAGDGIIIGIIDTGILPESLSFSDRTGVNGNATKDGKLAYQQIPGWHGKCTPGEEFNASMCNQKLIGAQRVNQAFGGDAGIDVVFHGTWILYVTLAVTARILPLLLVVTMACRLPALLLCLVPLVVLLRMPALQPTRLCGKSRPDRAVAIPLTSSQQSIRRLPMAWM